MSLAAIEEDYLVDLDAEGNRLYKEMTQVEQEWIQATGFRHLDLGHRTHLLIANHLDLPAMGQLMATRRAFKQYLMDNSVGRPETIGNRSTAMPVWIMGPGKASQKPVNSPPLIDELVHVDRLRIRRQMAFRGTRLSENDVLSLFDQWIYKTQNTVETHRKYRQKKRSEDSAEELAELMSQREDVIRLIRESGGRISARLHSGQAVCIHARTDHLSWKSSIATVGLYYGSEQTRVEEITEPMRRSSSRQTPIATIGRLVFYSVVN
jgi:hypothetical protein